MPLVRHIVPLKQIEYGNHTIAIYPYSIYLSGTIPRPTACPQVFLQTKSLVIPDLRNGVQSLELAELPGQHVAKVSIRVITL